MPECAPVSTHPGQEGLREAGFRAKTGLEEPHGQRFPVTCLALDAKRALCSPSLEFPRNDWKGHTTQFNSQILDCRSERNKLFVNKLSDCW